MPLLGIVAASLFGGATDMTSPEPELRPAYSHLQSKFIRRRTMKGYKGTVVFYKNPDYSRFFCAALSFESLEEYLNRREKDPDFIYLGHCQVDVAFGDTTAAEIEALEKQVQQERAESMHRINLLQGRIQEKRALKHEGE